MVEIDTGTEELLCTVRDRVAVVTLNKPHKKNALGDILTPALRELLPVIEADDRVGVVMITGAGDAFCSGGDVSGMGGASSAPKSEAERIDELTFKQETLTLRLHQLGKVIHFIFYGALSKETHLARYCLIVFWTLLSKIGRHN